MLHECPYFCFSANVSVTAQTVQNTSTPSSYAGAAKAPRSVAFHSVLPSVASKPSEDQREKAKGKEKEVEKRRSSELSKESSQYNIWIKAKLLVHCLSTFRKRLTP